MKKAGRVTQNFFTAFSDFLAAYSGIVEIVKGAGQQYGEAAYEALSLFLIVRYKASCRGGQLLTAAGGCQQEQQR